MGFPKRLSFEIGPYFLALSSSHFSAVLAFIALRRPRLWPIMGNPNDPGGILCDDLFPLLLRRRKMGRRKMERIKKIFICVCLTVCKEGEGGRERDK